MKRIIGLILILAVAASVYGAVNTQTWSHILKSWTVAGDSVHSRGIAGTDTLFLNLFDLIYGTYIECDSIKTQKLGTTVDYEFNTAGDLCRGDSGVTDSILTTRKQVRLLINDSIQQHWTAFIGTGAAVDSTEITDGNVTTADLRDTSVTTAKIARSSIDSTKLGENCVLAAEIAAGAVGASEIAALGVDTADFAANVAVDSGRILDAGVGYADLGTGAVNLINGNIRDTAGVMIHDTLASLRRQIFELVDVASQDHPLGDNCVLTLGRFTTGVDSLSYLYMDSSAADAAQDTAVISGIMPGGATQLDSLLIVYNTSSATATTSKIDAVRVWVTDGFAGACSVQKEVLTDSANTAISVYEIMGGADTDFDGGETIRLRIIFEGDANAWLKVYKVIGVCR